MHAVLMLQLYQNMNKLTNYLEESPSCEANSSSASQEIPCTLSNRKVHYCVQQNTPEPM